MWTDPMRKHCDEVLEKLQNSVEVDIVSPAMFMPIDKLIEHTDFYVNVVRGRDNSK